MEKKYQKIRKCTPTVLAVAKITQKRHNGVSPLWPPFSQSLGELENFYFWFWALGILPKV